MQARIPIQDGKQETFEDAFAAAIGTTRNGAAVLVYNLRREAADGTRYVVLSDGRASRTWKTIRESRMLRNSWQ